MGSCLGKADFSQWGRGGRKKVTWQRAIVYEVTIARSALGAQSSPSKLTYWLRKTIIW